MVPDWDTPSDDSPQARSLLKAHCHDTRPLGLIQTGDTELLVVYECGFCRISLVLHTLLSVS